MERAISVLTQFDNMTEEQINFFIEKVKNEILVRQALPLLASLTIMSKIVDGVKDAIKDQLLEEALIEGQKSFTINGVKYEQRTKKTYKYDHCPSWVDLDTKKKELEKKMQVITAPMADTETGEIIPPAHWRASDYIAVTLKRS